MPVSPVATSAGPRDRILDSAGGSCVDDTDVEAVPNVVASLSFKESVSTSADRILACKAASLMMIIAGMLLIGQIGARKLASCEPAVILKDTA